MPKMFYCQEDGAQWNVPVHVIDEETVLGTETIVIIMGKSLIGTVTIGEFQLMLVNRQDLHECPLP